MSGAWLDKSGNNDFVELVNTFTKDRLDFPKRLGANAIQVSSRSVDGEKNGSDKRHQWQPLEHRPLGGQNQR